MELNSTVGSKSISETESQVPPSPQAAKLTIPSSILAKDYMAMWGEKMGLGDWETPEAFEGEFNHPKNKGFMESLSWLSGWQI